MLATCVSSKRYGHRIVIRKLIFIGKSLAQKLWPIRENLHKSFQATFCAICHFNAKNYGPLWSLWRFGLLSSLGRIQEIIPCLTDGLVQSIGHGFALLADFTKCRHRLDVQRRKIGTFSPSPLMLWVVLPLTIIPYGCSYKLAVNSNEFSLYTSITFAVARFTWSINSVMRIQQQCRVMEVLDAIWCGTCWHWSGHNKYLIES